MKTSTSEGKHGIQWTSRMQLDDLDFEDDLAFLSQTQQQIQEKTNDGAAASAAVGLNIHKGIFNENVKTVLLYGAESWRTSRAIIQKIQVFINSCLRKILRIRWPYTISSNVLW
ncbi:unnamed protein product [Schistosoma margrebowiei]|uniref:Uncharacterized protein n=1 Tax=Schistosoma margrebowiei TaxID=48269 RepID=A0A183MNB3_9TREM|nr:unnamed protein product [Schistosoma margrebowiei]